MQHLIFVYGTLRKGENNHHLLEKSEYLGLFETDPDYQLVDLGSYLGMIKGNSKITGEVYRIDDQLLAQLDVLENVPDEYHRETMDTPYGVAWIYLYHGAAQTDEAIASGNRLYREQ